VSILLANKGVLPTIIFIVIIFVFIVGGARYLGEIIGHKQQKMLDEVSQKSDENKEQSKAASYKASPTEKL
jgi:UDP-GlcNAc:undecaprenyl-phosphate GlcNAc-1-phosphate transferase